MDRPFITVGAGYQPSPLHGSKFDMAQQMRENPSPGEDALWKALQTHRDRVGRKVLRVNRQQVIRGFIADFYLPTQRAIVEVDGEQHRASAEYDGRRNALFEQWNYSIFRLAHRLVMADPDLAAHLVWSFAEEIGDSAYERHWRNWRYDDYGVLREVRATRDGYLPRHYFRISPDLPECVVCEWGGVDGDIDSHAVAECPGSQCGSWAA